jgi:FAD/FMN-containing dehydrogenase
VNQASDDFGHLVHRIPATVLRPTSAAEVAEAVRRVNETGDRIAAQGRRHSVWGRSQVDGGVVLDMGDLRTVHSVDGDRVVVDAGATWRDVLNATLPRGLTPPVLTDYLDLSVGGTLAVGGVGGTTYRSGVQADTVTELDIVTGAGEEVTCSAADRPDLFDAVRAGLGQVGVVTRATVTLVRAPETVRRFLLLHPDLASMLRDARLLAADGRFDAVQGAVLPMPDGTWAYRLDVARYVAGPAPKDRVLLAGLSDVRASREPTTLPYPEYLDRFSALESALRANGQWSYPHPWLLMFAGDSTVDALVGDELTRLDPAVDLGQFGQVVVSPIRRAAVTSPLFRLPGEELSFTVNIVRMPTTGDPDAARRLVASNRAIYERVRRAGGTLYPVSALPMSTEDWRLHFGSAYDSLAEAKRRYDPRGVLTPGYEFAEPVEYPEGVVPAKS